MTRKDIETELQRRAERHKPQTHIIANYYRIRRKLAYPLPIGKMILPKMLVPGIPVYPWSIWVLWDLEERINSLGWIGTWFGDEDVRRLVRRDLDALAGWPCYRQYERPDLSLGHCSRQMWLAYTQWDWLGDVKGKIEDAFARIVDDALKYSDDLHGRFESKDDILGLDEPHSVLHNIPLIGTLGIALAAHAINHDAAVLLDRRLHAILGAILDLREGGHTEGVGYDGYIMDFVVHWLQAIDEADRKPVMDHVRFDDLLDESIHLSAPGHVANVAEIGDVEPKEMPYHLAAHAKLLTLCPNPRATWLLNRCRIDWLRADALGMLHGVIEDADEFVPDRGMGDAHYAMTLRSGWERDDLAVAMSVCCSPMGHLPPDGGSLVIGSQGRWLIDDPGYQQYMKKTERTFTLGVTAHNAPVINGEAQTRKLSRRETTLDELDDAGYRASVDLTSGYPGDLGLDAVKRTVWLEGKHLIVVGDRVSGKGIERISYHWHGHPDAAWWVADNWARIYFSDVTLWVTSPQAVFSGANVDRLPGSRGQLTLVTEADTTSPVIWWVFSIGDAAPDLKVHDDGLTIDVNGVLFDAR